MYLCIPVIIIILSSTYVLIKADIPLMIRGDACSTPYGERATCISILSCPGLLTRLLAKNESDKDLAVAYQCGYDTEPLVCCRFLDYPPGTFDVFIKPSQAPPYIDPAIENSFPYEDLPEVQDCGNDTRTNGILSDGTEFPWLVALGYTNKFNGRNVGIRCGGSIINKKYILTAAQCIEDKEFALTDIWAGVSRVSIDRHCEELTPNYKANNRITKLEVAEFIPHPFYSTRTRNNDIGLIRLIDEIQYTDYVQPICLPPPDLAVPTARTAMVITGWEKRCRSQKDEKLNQGVQLISNYVCDKSNINRHVGPNQICAGGNTNQGDPGGLLMRLCDHGKDQRWFQEGVGAWGDGYQRNGDPLIYTRVTRYIRWIANIIKRESHKDEKYY